MNALRAAIESNNQSASNQSVIGAFWQEIQKSGTPLIERPATDDDKEQKEMLVTFLWKGTAATKNVLIVWFPFTMQTPADYRLEQIPNSDIWYRTLKVDARKRFIYRLAPNAPNFRAADDEEGSVPQNLGRIANRSAESQSLGRRSIRSRRAGTPGIFRGGNAEGAGAAVGHRAAKMLPKEKSSGTNCRPLC